MDFIPCWYSYGSPLRGTSNHEWEGSLNLRQGIEDIFHWQTQLLGQKILLKRDMDTTYLKIDVFNYLYSLLQNIYISQIAIPEFTLSLVFICKLCYPVSKIEGLER